MGVAAEKTVVGMAREEEGMVSGAEEMVEEEMVFGVEEGVEDVAGT